jgi:hypothetical protein
VKSRWLLLISLSLILGSVVYAAQDYVKDYPELERLLSKGSAQSRDELNKMLSSMSPDRRQKFVQGLIDAAEEMEKNAIIVESVFAGLVATGITMRKR